MLLFSVSISYEFMRLVRMGIFGIEYMSVEIWSKLLPNCTATWWQALRFLRNQLWRILRVFCKFLENMQTANCMASSTFQLWTNYVCQENDIPGVCLWLWNRMATQQPGSRCTIRLEIHFFFLLAEFFIQLNSADFIDSSSRKLHNLMSSESHRG